MDMRMPGWGGVKATEAIRKLDPQARVIIMSQFIEKEFRDQALAAGALEFLDKEELCRLPDIIGVSESKS
jgi:DNA-binding NarL/FixJ family response regulator